MPDNNKVNIFPFYFTHPQRIINTNRKQAFLRVCFTVTVLLCGVVNVIAQACLPNFDFEKGDFTNWECSSGFIGQDGVLNLSASGPATDRHTIIKSTADGKLDQYGDFLVNSPN